MLEALAMEFLVVFEQRIHHVEGEHLPMVIIEPCYDNRIILDGFFILHFGSNRIFYFLQWDLFFIDIGASIMVGKPFVKEIFNLIIIQFFFISYKF